MTAALFLLDAGRLTGATPGQTIVVDGAEGRHAATVKRIEPGEPVLLADGTRIAYLVAGTGQPLVMVHGSMTVADEWLPVADRLAEQVGRQA